LKHLLLIFFFASVTIASCKTIKVSERSTFVATKYNYESFSNSILESNLSDQQKRIFILSAGKIVNTDEEEIIVLGPVKLKRQFLVVNDTITLEYFIFEPKHIKKRGIYFLGNGTSILNVAEKLFELSAGTSSKIFVLNYRGSGKSKGTPSFRTQFIDNQTFITSIEVKERETLQFCVGYSLGSIFATYSAVENNIGHLYLLSPFSNSQQLFKYAKKQNTKGLKALLRPFIKVTADDYLSGISNIEKIQNYNGKLVVFHGTKDYILPYTMGESLYRSYNSENKEFIPLIDGGHGAAFESNNWEILIRKIE